MTKKKSKKKLIVSLSIVVVLAIVATVVLTGMNNRQAQATDDGYEVVSVQMQDMQVEITGSGSAVAADSTQYYAPVELKIDAVHVSEGSEIAQGDMIATLDADALDAQTRLIEEEIEAINTEISSMNSTEGDTTLPAPASGVIKQINVTDGDLINVAMDAHGTLAVISADDKMKVLTQATDITAISEGDIVSITIKEDVEEEGEVITSVISDVDPQANTFEFVVEDDDYEIGTGVQVMSENGTLLGEGVMEVNIPVYLEATTGVVYDVEVEVGDYVDRNDTVITLEEEGLMSESVIALAEDRTRLENELAEIYEALAVFGFDSTYTLYAPQNGIVTSLNLTDNSVTQADAPMFTLLTTDMLEMVVSIDELEILEVEVGQAANVAFEAIPGQIITAEVTDINTVGVSNNNVTNYDVTVTFPRAEGVLIGMSGTADILSESRDNAVTIPLEAVQIINNEYYVILGADAGVKTVADHKISVGINNGTYIEVTDGLSEGDTVVIPSVSPDESSIMQGMGSMAGMTGMTGGSVGGSMSGGGLRR